MAFAVLDTHIAGSSRRRHLRFDIAAPWQQLVDARVMPRRPKSHMPSHAFESIDLSDSILSPNWRNRTQIKAKKSRKSPQFVIIMWAV